MRTHPAWRPIEIGLAGLLLAAAAFGSNGMNMIGYGAESIAMGGADLALTASPSAMNINPAGIAWCAEPEIDFGFGLMEPSLEHSDRFGNRRSDELDRYPMPFVGYVHPVGEVTLGVGLFVQGGMGAEYTGLVTPFAAMAAGGALGPGPTPASSLPPTDLTRTSVMHVKLSPSVAWRVRPGLSVGASLDVSYARAELALFPETSVVADLDGSGRPGDSTADAFFGMAGEDLSGVGYGLRLGLQYRRGDLSLGAIYFSETDLSLDGGSMFLNLSALGLGKVGYDCEMAGLTWPQHAGAGVAYRLTPSVKLAGDVDWVGWSSAIDTVTIRIDSPDRPGAPPTREIPLRMGWRDQWVFAAGLEWQARAAWAVRFGFNHGDSPIPDSMLRPLFPAIAEDHLTAGLGWRGGGWIVDFALEYVLSIDRVNDSRDRAVNPFGPGSREQLSQVVAHLMVRRPLGSRTSRAPGP